MSLYSHQMADYLHQQLPTDEPHIRLLILPPGNASGDIQCSIFHCPVSSAPDYKAVSYCWGDPGDRTTIICDGRSLSVPSTLRPFLLQIRAKGRGMVLWIDSICINQTDDDEKASQVRDMHNVYRKAKKTLIWLGPGTESSQKGLDFAKILYEFSIVPTDQRTWSHRLRTSMACAGISLHHWVAFFELFDRTWFTRVWIVQEVVLSPNPWIICGDIVLSWISLAKALHYAWSDQLWIMEFHGTINLNLILWMYMTQEEVSKGRKRLHYEILARHRQSVAFDARDTIFGFRGLSGHASFEDHNITPTYKLDAKEVFLDLAVATLTKATNLDFLSIPRLESHNHCADLPSWVVDWSCRVPVCFSLLKVEHGCATRRDVLPYNATKNTICKPIIDTEAKCLKLSGYTTDQITSLGRCWEMPDTGGPVSIRKQAATIKKNQDYLMDWISVAGSHPKAVYINDEAMHDVFWQVCVAGFFSINKKTTQDNYVRFEKRNRILRLIPRLGLQDYMWVWVIVAIIERILRIVGIPNPEIALRADLSSMINRSIFRTEKGYLGLGPAIAETGDRVALLRGGRTPYIVRLNAGGWEFIGDAYVHGTMDGELWEDEKCHEMTFN